MMQLPVKRMAIVLLAAAWSVGSAQAAQPEDAFVCMEETQAQCDHKNKNLELYIKGHDAFDRGREIGDFNEARNIALELLARSETRHAKALLKHIYMQVMQGVHKDYVEAYRWVAADMAAGVTYARLPLERVLASLKEKMSARQLADAMK